MLHAGDTEGCVFILLTFKRLGEPGLFDLLYNALIFYLLSLFQRTNPALNFPRGQSFLETNQSYRSLVVHDLPVFMMDLK